jgi:hypothetical protein
MVASLAKPKLQLILVPEPIAMLPNPRRILLDAAGRPRNSQPWIWLMNPGNADYYLL